MRRIKSTAETAGPRAHRKWTGYRNVEPVATSILSPPIDTRRYPSAVPIVPEVSRTRTRTRTIGLVLCAFLPPHLSLATKR